MGCAEAPGWLSRLSDTLDYGSGFDLRVVSSSSTLGSTVGIEPTLFYLFIFLEPTLEKKKKVVIRDSQLL